MNETATRMLLSPSRRRLADVAEIGEAGSKQLQRLGWTPYDGPAYATSGLDEHASEETMTELGITMHVTASGALHKGTRNGWVISGTDPIVDAQRFDRTKTFTLGPGRIS